MDVHVDLTGFGEDRIRAAVQAAMKRAPEGAAQVLPTPARLEQGAKATLENRLEDESTYFVSLLEIAWLVASADGFAEQERHALSELLEQILGRAVGRDVLELHFKDLGDACEMLGRRERMRRAAEDFSVTASSKEALGFAALVAMADGQLAGPEHDALVELGGHLGFSKTLVDEIIEAVVSRLRAELES
jgi:tellurite resistance protein